MQDKGWSYAVTHRVPATFHSVGAFTRSAEEIYKEMRRPEVSPKGLASAISMNQFFINRAGKALDPKRREEVKKSIRYLQAELKYRNALAKGAKNVEQLEKEWKELIAHIDMTGQPNPAEKQMTNKYLDKIAGVREMAGAAKTGAQKFTRAFKGTDAADMKDLLKRTPVDRDNLAARVDIQKRLKDATRQMYAARGAVGAGAAGAVAGAAKLAKGDKKSKDD